MMAIISCSECGKEISTSAERCPHCGCQTNHGKEKSSAILLLIILIANVLAILIGGYLFFPAISTIIENIDNRYFWEALKYSDTVKETFIRFILGCGLFVGGISGMIGMRKDVKKLLQSNPSIPPVRKQIERIPVDKAQPGTCDKCGKQTTIAICHLYGSPYDSKLCLDCINKFGAQIKEYI